MSKVYRFSPITVKKFHYKCQQGVNNEQNLVIVVFELPLFSKYPNREEDHRTLCHSSMYQGQGTNMDRKTQKFLLLYYVCIIEGCIADRHAGSFLNMVGTNLIGGHNICIIPPPLLDCNGFNVSSKTYSRGKSYCPLYAPACLGLIMLVLQNQRLPSSDLLHLKGLYSLPTQLLFCAPKVENIT